MNRLRIAFLASNKGSGFRAINEAIRSQSLNAEAVLLVSNRASSTALEYARVNEIPCRQIPTLEVEDDADAQLREALRRCRAELVVLSGYLKKLGPLTLEAFDGRILNVHPGPLPKYGGLGMYGRRVHQAVLDAGEVATAATIHLVDAEYDHGRAVAAETVPIFLSDSPATLEQRVMEAECRAYISFLRSIAGGEISLPL